MRKMTEKQLKKWEQSRDISDEILQGIRIGKLHFLDLLATLGVGVVDLLHLVPHPLRLIRDPHLHRVSLTVLVDGGVINKSVPLGKDALWSPTSRALVIGELSEGESSLTLPVRDTRLDVELPPPLRPVDQLLAILAWRVIALPLLHGLQAPRLIIQNLGADVDVATGLPLRLNAIGRDAMVLAKAPIAMLGLVADEAQLVSLPCLAFDLLRLLLAWAPLATTLTPAAPALALVRVLRRVLLLNIQSTGQTILLGEHAGVVKVVIPLHRHAGDRASAQELPS